MITFFMIRISRELGKDVRVTWGFWGASTILFPVPGDSYKGYYL